MDSLINILLCVLGYFPGLIHSWYIIAKYPPYARRYEQKIYYIQQGASDLESQNQHHHHYHHYHHHNSHGTSLISLEPLVTSAPNYGSTNETTLREGTFVGGPSADPPAYSDLPLQK